MARDHISPDSPEDAPTSGAVAPSFAPLVEAIFDTLPLNVFLKDEHNRIVFCNRAIRESIGVSREQVIGKTDFDIFPRETAMRLREADSYVRRTGKPLLEEEEIEREGKTIYLMAGKTLLRHGDRDFLIGFSIDVTDRHAIQRELTRQTELMRQVFDADPNMIYVKGPDGRYRLANRALAQLLGGAPEAVVGKSLAELHWRPEEVLVDLAADDIVHRERREHAEEIQWTLPNGTAKWFHAIRRPLPQPNGETHILGIWVETTDRHEAMEALRAAKDTAERASQAKSDFLATMSHELRTPMNGVMGMASLLLDGELTGDQRMMVDTILESAEGLLRILNDILDFSKIEAGRLQLDEHVVNVRSLAEHAMGLLRPRARAKGLEVCVEVAADVPHWVEADPGRLRQVLLNLLSNAIKFTAEGRLTLRIRCGGMKTLAPMLWFEVEDTGIGISLEAQTRLFRRFSQVDASASRRYGGTGLGLAICKGIVEAMGGTIGVASAEGVGSTFWFELPLVEAASPSQKEPPAGRSSPSPPCIQIRPGVRVLLAEDNAVNQLVLRRMLELRQCIVHCVGDGAEAVAAVQHGTYDAVLMDMHMPTLDGVAAARAIRALAGPQSQIPIVAISASVSPDGVSDSVAAGMNGFVAKPIDASELCSALCAVLGEAASDGAAASGETRAETCSDSENDSSLAPMAAPHPTPAPWHAVDSKQVRELLTYLGRDEVKGVAALLVDHLEQQCAALNVAIQQRDGESIARIAHTIKSGAGNLGFVGLANVADEAERRAPQGEWQPAMALVWCARDLQPRVLDLLFPAASDRAASDRDASDRDET